MYKETDKPVPINCYGLTKLKGEESVKATVDNYCIARPSVIYGSNPATGKINFALWLIDKLQKNEKVKIIKDQWNSPTLNTNLANMILEILEQKITGTYHLAGATRINRYEFAKLIAQIFCLNTKLITPVLTNEFPWTAKRPKDSSLSINKASKKLNNKPLKVQEALEEMKNEIGKRVPFKLCKSTSSARGKRKRSKSQLDVSKNH